jgi:hypothetical protein
LIVHVPAVTKVSAPPLVIVHTPVVDDVNVTVRPELAVAVSVGVVPKFCAPGFAKVIVCAPFGVTLFDAAEAAPVPALLVAVTVKVYAVPLVRLLTVIGLAAPVPVRPPGFDTTVYPVTVAPPLLAGAVNETVACVSPAVAVPMVGAPGTTGFTVNDRDTCVAARYLPLPAWSALIVQVPAVTNVSAPPLVIVHTPVVDEVNVTVSPELAVAVSVGAVPKFCAPGFAKVIVCAPFGVTLFDAAEAAPVPALFVAVTVKVYAVPLVRPLTTMGLAAPVPVRPPGFEVTVYPVMVAPPLLAGAVKDTVACVSPAVAVPTVGAPGTTGFTANDCETCVAAR